MSVPPHMQGRCDWCFSPLGDVAESFGKLPPLERPEDAMTATAALLQAVATGELTPSEAETVGKLLETHRRVTELVDVEARLTRLKQHKGLRP
jgi:hypothetical protein